MGAFTPPEDGEDMCLHPVLESLRHLDTSPSISLSLSLSALSLVWLGGRRYPALPAITIRLGVLAGILYEHSPLTRA